MNMGPDNCLKLSIIIPMYNDMEVVELLIKQLDDVLDVQTIMTTIILIDDGSTEHIKKEFMTKPLRSISSVDIIYLKVNLGHQRAIAVGLSYLSEKNHCDAVIVMDGDGEAGVCQDSCRVYHHAALIVNLPEAVFSPRGGFSQTSVGRSQLRVSLAHRFGCLALAAS